MKLGETCMHGSLKRSCETCEIADERERWYKQAHESEQRYLNASAEIDRLKAELAASEPGRLHLVSEIDRLKAAEKVTLKERNELWGEVARLKAQWDLIKRNMKKMWSEYALMDEVITDRDLWKSKAEKLVKALKNIESNYDCECVVGDRLRGAHKCQGCWAKEALEEYGSK